MFETTSKKLMLRLQGRVSVALEWEEWHHMTVTGLVVEPTPLKNDGVRQLG